jgi:hypothetical protein
MPLTINVGLSRKASKDFQSTGTSINITAELDQSLLARPDELQGQIARLYQEAETALDRRIAPPEPKASHNGNGDSHAAPGASQTPARDGNGQGTVPPMTESQNRAIHAIARRLGLDPAAECTRVFSWTLDCLRNVLVHQAQAVTSWIHGPAGAVQGRTGWSQSTWLRRPPRLRRASTMCSGCRCASDAGVWVSYQGNGAQGWPLDLAANRTRGCYRTDRLRVCRAGWSDHG